jgi:hypothetical protein
MSLTGVYWADKPYILPVKRRLTLYYSLPSVELYTKARIIDEQGRAIKSNKL